MAEVKESMVSSFQWSSKTGILCDENMRGMRFNIIDCELHTDAIHRGGGQIMPTARRLYFALELLSQPSLVEPIFSCDITAPSDCMGGVYQSLNQRRGIVIEEIQISGTPLNLVKAFLPVSESFGFTGMLRGNTQGKAFPQCVFDHWELIKGLPLIDEKARNTVLTIRKRKGLKEGIPDVNEYMDKL
jgi:elongation factor 2